MSKLPQTEGRQIGSWQGVEACDMSDVQKCLSVFAVAAWANTPQSLGQAETAIDDYAAKHSGENEFAALTALQQAFENMRLDSVVAEKIRAEIADRIALLSGSPDRANVRSQSDSV